MRKSVFDRLQNSVTSNFLAELDLYTLLFSEKKPFLQGQKVKKLFDSKLYFFLTYENTTNSNRYNFPILL